MKILLITALVFLAGCGSTRTVIVPEVKMPEIPKELRTPARPLNTIKPLSEEE